MRRSTTFLRVLFVASAILCLGSGFTSCQSLSGALLTTKSSKERELAAVRSQYEAKLATNDTAGKIATKALLADKDAQMAKAGGSLWAADQAFTTVLAPTRTELVINGYVNEAWTALGHPMPNVQEMEDRNKRLKDELDEAKTTLAQLQSNHAIAMAQNQALADQSRLHNEELIRLANERRQLKDEAQAALDKVQGELNEVNDKLIAAETARADDAKAVQAQKTKLSLGAGILAALCVAGAIWSPLCKRQFVIGAAVFAGVAVAIPYIVGWHILALFGIVLVGLVVWTLYGHHKDLTAHAVEERLSDSLVLGLQRIKDASKETWAKVGPVIKDALGRYSTDAVGKTVVVPDPQLESLVDQKLRDYQQLGADTANP